MKTPLFLLFIVFAGKLFKPNKPFPDGPVLNKLIECPVRKMICPVRSHKQSKNGYNIQAINICVCHRINVPFDPACLKNILIFHQVKIAVGQNEIIDTLCSSLLMQLYARQTSVRYYYRSD